ncbi:MAG: hypothetical protein ACI81P_002851 [Neolewinella sp.]|jgi:hypothetical protein
MTTILAAAIPLSFGLMITLIWWSVNRPNFAGRQLVFCPFLPVCPKIRRS